MFRSQFIAIKDKSKIVKVYIYIYTYIFKKIFARTCGLKLLFMIQSHVGADTYPPNTSLP